MVIHVCSGLIHTFKIIVFLMVAAARLQIKERDLVAGVVCLHSNRVHGMIIGNFLGPCFSLTFENKAGAGS